MQLDRRQKTYVVVRCAAALVFVLALLMPPGLGAGLAILVAGVVAVLTCLGTLAGGPGEQAGARPQNRALQQMRAPQGDWPPYDDPPAAPVAELARRPEG
jgi:hypothetical protein